MFAVEYCDETLATQSNMLLYLIHFVILFILRPKITLLHISLITLLITSISGLRCRGKRICELVDTYFHALWFPGTTGPNKCGFLLCLGD